MCKMTDDFTGYCGGLDPPTSAAVQLLNREKVVMGTLGHLHNNSARGYLFYYLVLLVHLPPLCLSSWGLTLEFWTYVLVHNILHKRVCKFSTSCNQSLSSFLKT